MFEFKLLYIFKLLKYSIASNIENFNSNFIISFHVAYLTLHLKYNVNYLM